MWKDVKYIGYKYHNSELDGIRKVTFADIAYEKGVPNVSYSQC